MGGSEADYKLNYFISAAAGFLSGMIGSMGFGGGGVLIIYLVIFADYPQLKAQGINLIFFIPCAALSVIIYLFKKQIKFKEIYPVILGGICGALPAGFLLGGIDSRLLPKIFAAFLICTGILTVIKTKKENKLL